MFAGQTNPAIGAESSAFCNSSCKRAMHACAGACRFSSRHCVRPANTLLATYAACGSSAVEGNMPRTASKKIIAGLTAPCTSDQLLSFELYVSTARCTISAHRVRRDIASSDGDCGKLAKSRFARDRSPRPQSLSRLASS